MDKRIFSGFAFLLILSMGFVMAAQEGVHEPGTGLDDSELKVASQGTGQGLENKTRAQTGEFSGENGQMIRVQAKENNQFRLESGGVGVDCECELNQERIGNQTRLSVKLSNGKDSEVKVMPDAASETALQRLRLRVCSEDNNCTLELKEVGSGENAMLAYEVKTQRRAKFLGIFGTNMEVQAQVNAENGEVLQVNKPWWAFLASEPEEETEELESEETSE